MDPNPTERTSHEPHRARFPVPDTVRTQCAAFASMAARTVTQVAAAQSDAVARAARLMADSVEAGGVLQASAPATRRPSPWRSQGGLVG